MVVVGIAAGEFSRRQGCLWHTSVLSLHPGKPQDLTSIASVHLIERLLIGAGGVRL
jgi:hypothetical protein